MLPKPHPATYILFRPPMTSVHDEEEQEVFHAEGEPGRRRTLDYKKSCPALLGTASNRLARISECFDYASEEDEAQQEVVPEIDMLWSPLLQENSRCVLGHPQLTPNATLSKKRSFLLVDVIDSVEGRASIKRQDTRDSSSLLSNDSIDIISSRTTTSKIRQITRQKSDFEILYANSKELSKASEGARVELSANVCKNAESSLNNAANFQRSNKSDLRHRKSMITMSLRLNNSTSPSRTRLDRIDMDELTSFDQILQEPHNFKAAPAEVSLVTEPLLIRSFEARSHLKLKPQTNHQFRRNTELLKQLPATDVNRKSVKRLRHSKSAKEVLQKYKTKTELGPSGKAHTSAGMSSSSNEKERSSKKTSLRNGLRSLLGLRETG